jgi:hypothetical protein
MSFRATIHEAAQLEIPVIDLGHVSGDALESELRATISRLVADPFDFGAGPLIRVWLVRTAPREHRLLIVMPHLVADGWSLNILVREVFQFYVARRNGMDPLLPPAVQYADFAEYQRRRQKASVQKTSGSEVPFLEVADLRFLDSESRDVIGLAHDEAESEGTSLDEAFDALRAAAARARVTVSMFVFTCVCMYLYFQSAVSEFRVTITQANRTHPGLEDVFGFVASGQRIRMRFTESSVFASIAEAARREFSDAALRHEIDTAGRPRHGVAFEYNQLRTPSVPGLDVERFRLLARPSADFGLKFRLEERPAGLELCLDYCVDCFKRPVVGSVVHELGKLLDRTIGDPYARVSDLLIAA